MTLSSLSPWTPFRPQRPGRRFPGSLSSPPRNGDPPFSRLSRANSPAKKLSRLWLTCFARSDGESSTRESKTHDCIRQHRHADSTPPTAHIEQTSPLEDPGRPVRSAPPSSRRHRHLRGLPPEDRKSTRLNSSHVSISYAVFCLKKKKHP